MTESFLRYGAGEISGYTLGDKVLSITPDTISLDGKLYVLDTTNSTSRTTGAFVVTGGVGIGKKLYCGDDTNSTSTATGACVITGGLGVSRTISCTALNFGGSDLSTYSTTTIDVAVNTTISAWTDTTNTSLVGTLTKIGNTVTFSWGFRRRLADVGDDNINYDAAIPAGYRPSADRTFATWVYAAPNNTAGNVQIVAASGNVVFNSPVAATWLIGTECGYFGSSASWQV